MKLLLTLFERGIQLAQLQEIDLKLFDKKGWMLSTYLCVLMYTLPQKKCRLNPSIFPVDPGSLTLTQGHVRFTDIHSSPKEMQPRRTCISFCEECSRHFMSQPSRWLMKETISIF